MSNFNWMSNPQYLAQVGHFFGACTVILTTALFSTTSLTPVLTVLGIGVVLAGLKEFLFDTASWGEGDTWADSAMDFAFYVFGGVVGLGLTALSVYVHPR